MIPEGHHMAIEKVSSFGEFVKTRRIDLGMTLRDFCEKHALDPGNQSKIERGRLRPPQDQAKLSAFADALELKRDTPMWTRFFDLAFMERGRIPEQVLQDDELMAVLPVLLRTVQNQRLTKEQLIELIERIQEA